MPSRIRALATDYDGTLAADGHVDGDTIDALVRLRRSGRSLFLVTGRELDDLMGVFPHLDLFDEVVAENGALLYTPSSPPRERPLGAAPPPELVAALERRGVSPISTGRIIVATWQPHETAVLEAIRELGLELEVIFNKGAVMILPTGINKGSGLRAALADFDVDPNEVAAIGDAENDHSLLDACGLRVAVANAVPALKERAHVVTSRPRGQGVVEVVDRILGDAIAEPPAPALA